MHAFIQDRASARHHPALRAALPDGTGAESSSQRQQRHRLGPVEVDEELPRLGGQPQGVPVYPENWIEAELRDDKSFLFTELENEIAAKRTD